MRKPTLPQITVTLALALSLAAPSLALAATAKRGKKTVARKKIVARASKSRQSAGTAAQVGPASGPHAGDPNWKPQKKLDFNNALVETMNERPLDSLSALEEAEKNRRKAHLYKKRTDFIPETAETVRQVRYN